MGISDKVPGSNNPPSPLDNKGMNGMAGVNTTSPKVDYAMGNPGQATSPLTMEGGANKQTTELPIGPGVQGAINTGKSVNLGDGSSGGGGRGYIPA